MACRTARCLLAVALVGVLVGCGDGQRIISVTNAWALPAKVSPGGGTGLVYLTIVNTGDGTDTLTDISADLAESVELYRTKIEDDVASLRAVWSIAVPAHGEVRLDTVDYQVVLVGLRRNLRVGDIIVLTLTFEHAGRSRIGIRVRDQRVFPPGAAITAGPSGDA